MDQRLNIIFSADGTQLSKTINQLENQLKSFQNGLKNAQGVDSFNRISRAIEATKLRLEQLKSIGNPVNSAITGVNSSLNRLAQTSTQSTAAMINLGRVVQDAPYGFIGIANNLNPLLESFERLRETTGTTGGALKALGSSLLGAGGLGFAVSIVSSLLVVFGGKMFGAKKSTDEAKDSIDNLKASLDTLKDSFQNFSTGVDFRAKLRTAAAAASGKEGGALDIFGLREEIKANEQNIKKLDEQSKPLAEKIRNINKVFDDARNRAISDELKFGRSNKDPIVSLLDKYKNVSLQNIPESAIEKLSKKERAALKGYIELNTQLEDILKKRNDLTDDNAVKLFQIQEKANKLSKEQREDQLKELEKERDKIRKEKVRVPLFIEFVLDKTNDISKDLGFFQGKDIGKKLFGGTGKFNFKDTSLFPNLVDEDVVLKQAKAITDVLTPAFDGFIDAVKAGESPIKAFFKGVLESITQVIKKLIAAAIQAAIFQSIMAASGNPVGFLGTFKSILGIGGIASPTRFGGSGGLSINVSGQLFGRGTDLVAVVTQGQTSIRRVGG